MHLYEPEGPTHIYKEQSLMNTEISYLEHFFLYDGIDIYEELKIRFHETDKIVAKIDSFASKYFEYASYDFSHHQQLGYPS